MRLIPTGRDDERRSVPVRLPALELAVDRVAPRVLDFDVETVAAGFADPEWVPQKITCVSWSWIGKDEIHTRICGPEGLYGKPAKRARMLSALLSEIDRADVLTGHNIARFDLPVINAECVRLDLQPIRGALVEDTIKLVRTKGLKKGQDNLARLLRTNDNKMAMDWQQWQDAYDEPGWPDVIERAHSDVLMHKQMREILLERGLLKPPFRWRAA